MQQMQDHRMRSSQHNNKNRSRGRSRSRHPSSGGGNPLNRVYESNGPDVKVRGTAQTVADKYLQLGRDAQSSGDNVAAENFYQHAEHYLRILSAAQAYNQQYQQQQQQQQFQRPQDDIFDEEGGDDGAETDGGDGQSFERPQIAQEQPPAAAVTRSESQGEQPAEQREGESPQQQQNRSRDGRDRNRYRSNWDRREGDNRQAQPRNEPPRNEPPRDEPRGDQGRQEQPRTETPSPVKAQPAAEPASSTEGWDGPQPSFLKRPANNGAGRSRSERRPRREPSEAQESQAAPEQVPPVE
jgi:hypothetical protein